MRAGGSRPSASSLGRRVRKRSEYLEIQARGRRVSTPSFVLLVHPRGPARAGPARLGIIASRKVGGAVERNRAKRLIREAFRATRELWDDGIDVAVIVKRSLGDKKLADVVLEWRNVAPRIRRAGQTG